MLLGFFIYVLVNNKFAGYGLMILFFITLGVLPLLSIEHRLLTFDSASLGTYSKMNGFGDYGSSFSWTNVY